MTSEQKQLLIKDLCTRLPYGVIIHTWYEKYLDIKCTGVNVYTNVVDLDIPDDDDAKVYVDNVKPYLRPMSSMTKEEYCEYENYVLNEKDEQIRFCNQLNFYGRYHFDYRGLIPMGLALEAPKGMYKTE